MCARWTILAGCLLVNVCLGAIEGGTPAKLGAQRAAEVDAYRKLAEHVQGLHLTSSTTMRDFVLESDAVNVSVSAFIKGGEVTGVRHLADGSCEVDMELPTERLIREVKQFHSEHYRGRTVTTTDIEKIREYIRVERIKVTGTGVARSHRPIAPPRDAAPGGCAPRVEPIPSAQPRLLARRAALVDGYRKLAERVYGLQLTATTTVRDFAIENDGVHIQVDAIVRGAWEKEVRYLDDGSVEVDVAVSVERLVTKLHQIVDEYESPGCSRRFEFERQLQLVERNEIVVTGQGVAPDLTPSFPDPPFDSPESWKGRWIEIEFQTPAAP